MISGELGQVILVANNISMLCNFHQQMPGFGTRRRRVEAASKGVRPDMGAATG
jgi:hypothetical protein